MKVGGAGLYSKLRDELSFGFYTPSINRTVPEAEMKINHFYLKRLAVSKSVVQYKM
jgi:hypothetical protein